MKSATKHFALLSATVCLLILPGCRSFSPVGQVANTGPFDSRGNYIEDWADSPHKWNRGPAKPVTSPVVPDLPAIAKVDEPPANSIPLPSPATRPTTSPAPPTKPKPQVVTAPKPKPKPTPPKPKPPTTVRHTVKKGDTLSGIASRYGSSVSAIQRANNLRGTLIRIGQTLTVPKR